MEAILRGKEIFNVISFGLDQPVAFYPIRHHSPACSYHLLRFIEQYQPDCILVEGPENANDLIPVLTDEHSKLPIAFYYCYKDKEKLISQDADSYKCYYPFVNASPEYNAFVEAKKRGIKARFIDLPYGEILIHTVRNMGIRKEIEKNNYNDDYYLSRGLLYQALCEKTGVRDFEEFWEKYFEVNGLYDTTTDFIAKVLTYCYLTRINTPEDILKQDGCIVREYYMAKQIVKAMKANHKVLVVTGGFHTYGLYQLVCEHKLQEDSVPKLHSFSKEVQSSYAMAYSLAATDALNGYTSGMQSPGFYDSIWEKLKERTSDNTRSEVAGIYSDVTLEMILKTAKASLKRNCLITTADIISATDLSLGLANLRDKYEPGICELRDCIRSTFIKGELNVVTQKPLQLLQEIMTGESLGTLPKSAMVPPIIHDYEEQCKFFGLELTSTIGHLVELDLFAKSKHMRLSRFFHRMNYLNTGFVIRKQGADLINNKDRSRIRESWEYKWNSNVITALIDLSVEGATVEEACKSIARKKILKEQSCCNVAKICVNALLMGIELKEDIVQYVDTVVKDDSDFFSLGKGMRYFYMMTKIKDLYGYDTKSTNDYLNICFEKLIFLLPTVVNMEESKSFECCEICKMLYSLSLEDLLYEKQEQLRIAFSDVLMKDKDARVHGTIIGLLYCYDHSYYIDIKKAMNYYLKSESAIRIQGARFLRGLFYTARDIVLVSDEFVSWMDCFVKEMDIDSFMEVIPELRMAFSYFSPSEIECIAKKVAIIYGVEEEQFKQAFTTDDMLYAIGVKLDQRIMGEMDAEFTR